MTFPKLNMIIYSNKVYFKLLGDALNPIGNVKETILMFSLRFLKKEKRVV